MLLRVARPRVPRLLLGLAVAWASVAWAGDPVADAEQVRLSQDIKQLTQREAWVGVERKFEELEALGLPLSYDDLYRGACAARALGDAQAVYDRLKAASLVDPRRDVLDWMYAIDSNYAHIELLSDRPRGGTLTTSAMPFDPDQRSAVLLAMAKVQREGSFTGLLPRGTYTFLGQTFTVDPGVAQHVEVRARRKKTEEEP